MAEWSIGEASADSGVPTKTIRYYEDVGLLPPPMRAANGYRVYDENALHVLRFVARARGLGFSVEAVGSLLALWLDRKRRSGEVRRIAEAHLAEIDRKLEELAQLRSSLENLVVRCHGDDRPDCPILDELAGTLGAATQARSGGVQPAPTPSTRSS